MFHYNGSMKQRIVGRLLLAFFFFLLFCQWVWALPAKQSLDHFVYLPIISNPFPTPQILYFESNVTVADPGDTIELSWATENAISVTLYHMMPSGQFGEFWNVAVTGTMTYTISESARNIERFMLFAGSEGLPWAGVGVEIILNCPFPWFFAPAPDICAQNAALISPAAEQQFEHGWMIWVEEEDFIYVLYDDDLFYPKWQIYLDEWDPGEPISDTTIIPPPGLFQPLRGFGQVWREQLNVRDRLGWAVVTESGYETAVQHTSYSRYNHIYIRALDNDIWNLLPEHSGWEKFTPTP